ncbi:MAG: DNA-directed RNA polymerase subunit alpha C-terminal domain-containing protein [Flexilinea sp.]
MEDKKTREDSKTSPDRLITEVNLGKRPTEILAEAGLVTVADVLVKLAEGGDNALLDIHGFGQKSLIDLKKKLRALGYEIAGSEE